MKVTNDTLYIGVNDRQVDLFEGQYSVPNGMSYNSYVISDEKTAVLDSVEAHFTAEWLDKLRTALKGRTPDYLIIQHMEPDHSAGLQAFAEAFPGATFVVNARTVPMLGAFFPSLDLSGRTLIVKDGDTLTLGRHTLRFILAPMVHWPEVMLTYDEADKTLFSADAFGKFGALDCDEPWEDEARRYYIGIVGKFGAQVQPVLKKAAELAIDRICPLHGPVLSDNIGHYLHLYDLWSSYQPETDGITIAYASVYGHTKEAAEELAKRLRALGCDDVRLYDLARCDMAAAVADAFRCRKLVLASTTYNADVFPPMRAFVEHLTERNYQNRTVGFIENGSWAPQAAKVMQRLLEAGKNLTFLETTVRIKSALNDESRAQLAQMAEALSKA